MPSASGTIMCLGHRMLFSLKPHCFPVSVEISQMLTWRDLVGRLEKNSLKNRVRGDRGHAMDSGKVES